MEIGLNGSVITMICYILVMILAAGLSKIVQCKNAEEKGGNV